MENPGVVNDIWAIGDNLVLRVPREVDYGPTVLAESVALPAARKAGLKVPEIVVFDNDLDLVETPFVILERVPGRALGLMPRCATWELATYLYEPVLKEIGAQLAQLHKSVLTVDDPQGWLNPWWSDDPMEGLEKCESSSLISISEVNWLDSFLQNLRGAFELDPNGPCAYKAFVHHDVHPWNVMVEQGSSEVLAMTSLLDWGNACFGDPAVDLSSFPLWAMPLLLDAYAQGGGAVDAGMEGRILWFWLSVGLMEVASAGRKPLNHWRRFPEDRVKELIYRLPMMPDPWRLWAPA